MRAFLIASLGLVACSTNFNCPTAAPADGTTCSERGFTCEEGGGDHLRCSTISVCSNAPESTWTSQPPASTCSTTNDPSCADSYLDTPVGSQCATAGATCDYTEGRCVCAPCGTTTGDSTAWACRLWTDGLDAQCPTSREPLGSPCTVPGLVCRYQNTCTVSFGPDEQCLDDRWQPETGSPVACTEPTCGV